MRIKIKPFSDAIRAQYEYHGHHHPGDAGLDLFIVERVTINAGETVALHLGISCEPVDGKAYFLMPRSSVSKTPLRQANSVGLIDGGYRGEIIAVVDNIKDKDYTVEPGDRLFQIVAMDGSPIEFELVDSLSQTSRGSGGFGSTGR
ncbi:MAG: dUTP diphosphatase [Candidatus Marinimicrobia bacterium]|nr:dUTP diphosphatase [Candidatus Neomarinimicrobiota bacterium]MCF7840442.1 dUTP diphosphatase [Candidatus Neomarinimicrobiota bacterium]